MTSRIVANICKKTVNTLRKENGNTSLNRAAIFYFNQNTILYRCIQTSSSLNIAHSTISLYDVQSRRLHTKVPKTPDLIYIPHILRWLKTKFRLKMLQRTWDPEFTEGSFIYGSTKAISRITEIIHENKTDQLHGLLTMSAIIKLKDDISTRLTKLQRLIIKIKPEDIKILVPMKVSLSNEGQHKNCRVALRVLALKWVMQNNGALRLVLIALQTEFLRDYTPGVCPDWTISGFDILECTVLAKT